MPAGLISGGFIGSMGGNMTDTIIWCCLCLVAGLWMGFLLALILTMGRLTQWTEYEDAYTSGRIAALRYLYDRIAEWQNSAHGAEWSTLNSVLDMIAQILPEESKEK